MYLVLSKKRVPAHELTNEEMAVYLELNKIWREMSESGALPQGLKGLPFEQEDRLSLYRAVQKRTRSYDSDVVDTALEGLEEVGAISFANDSYIERLFSSWFKVASEELALEEMAAKYPWDDCIKDQMEQYGDKETAEKVCGAIKAKSQGLGKYKKSAASAKRVANRYASKLRQP